MDNGPVDVLYISYDGMTDPLGQSQVIPYLTHITKNGFRFTLLSCEKKARLIQHGDRIKALLDGHNITWVPIAYTKKPPVFSTWYDIEKLKSVAGSLHRNTPFKIVHCRSYIPSLVGFWMKKKFGVKFIFDMRGFWADERVDGGLWNLRNPLFNAVYRYFKSMELKFLKSADQVISLTHAGREELLKWDTTISPASVSVIPCCADTELFDPDKVSKDEKPFGAKN
jgi:glycosyltransferase involved in cell wall biosynthesis